ncbi:globin [Virgibacillus sp. NKC19-3]|uniref:globin domain-containing protein n=1 Tax=Virgibacillus saliphilus TaxID=2831674 RepID=UPI001C9B2604|nr:globin [Virgibacillus sp. NKC19-3]MBY7143117.1 globin [Virgibacillus sp. NKC19-3]
MAQIEHGNLFEAIGGFDQIDKLVTHFYNRVAQHPSLIPIFPDDLTETARKQRLFLTQFFGGPKVYSEERGHPMLRRRHLPFPITPERRDAWLACMEEALQAVEIEEPYRTVIFEKLTLTANHMMNTPE